MIQSGSRNAQGTDGPGYRFPDEFHPELVHAESGILSMANSGIDTNGSQFFITVAPTDWLNYKHAVFGKVVEGLEVVEAISAVETGAGDRPVESVVIYTVEIVRNGAATEAFDVGAYGLPVVGEAPARIARGGADLAVRFWREPRRDYVLSFSGDLESWTQADVLPTGEPGGEAEFTLTGLADGQERQFYRVAEVDNSSVPEAYFPESLVGKTLDLNVTSAGLRIVLYPDAERTEENQGEWLGTGDFNDDVGRRLDYLWFQEKSRGVLLFLLEGYVQFDLELLFIDEQSGTFSGIARTGESPPNMHGTFTLRARD